MTPRARVIIIGGGLAGLSAAVACLDGGVPVRLLESRPWLGGATWSVRRRGLRVDNGQHVFLRCCTAYRALLQRLGVVDRVTLQDRLAIPIVAPGARWAWLRRDPLPSPLHLARSLLRFIHLPWRERWRTARIARVLGALDSTDSAVDECSFGSWLTAHGAGAAAIDTFWDLLIRPTLNLPAREASLALAAKVFQTGLLVEPDGADVGYATVPLEDVHAEPAAALLRAGGAELRVRARVDRIEAGARPGITVWTGGEPLVADAVIVATPHDVTAQLLPPAAGVDPAGLFRLGHSPIVNLHLLFDRRVMTVPFLAGIGSRVQWAFDRTAAAGVGHGQYITISLSAADEYVAMPEATLREVFVPELAALLPAAEHARVEQFFVTREPRATFRQGPGTLRWRPTARTQVPGLYLAGTWTDTGWPATMESAVRSGLTAARAALMDLGRTNNLPAEAA